MISAQLLGYPAVGYGALVERHFDVRLSKDQQRTDWSRRPLRDVQIDYAAADVRYLVELSQILERELESLGRLGLGAEAEFLALEQRVWPEREFDQQGYLRIKGARKLTPRGLAVLRELFLLRDKRARDGDRPPFKVMGNGTLARPGAEPAPLAPRARQAPRHHRPRAAAPRARSCRRGGARARRARAPAARAQGRRRTGAAGSTAAARRGSRS